MQTADRFTETLANRIHELEAANKRLRNRITTLERTRDRQRNLIRGLYYQMSLHRARVRSARQSRDMWRHRCMVKDNA
jgi:hypothetical protein